MIRINLIPPEYAEAEARRQQKIILGSTGITLVVFMILFWAFQEARARGLQKDVAVAEDRLRQYQAIVDQINEIETKKGQLVAKRDVILNLNRTRLLYPVFFEDLLPLIPSDVWVTDIRMEKSSGLSMDYKLTSKALSNFALATWLTNLEQSTNFSRVKLSQITYEAATAENSLSALSFQISFSYQHQGAFPLSEFN